MRQYAPIITGTPLAIVNPMSDMEHDMLHNFNINTLIFKEWATTGHGAYARVADDQGVTWLVHPEALAPHPDIPPKYKLKVRACYQPRPENIPTGWIVFNAPRPILGSYHPQTDERMEWTGDFLSGRFWTAASPDDKAAIKHNQDMDAVIVEFVQYPAKTYAMILQHKWQDRPEMLRRIDKTLEHGPMEMIRQNLAREMAKLTLDQWQAIAK